MNLHTIRSAAVHAAEAAVVADLQNKGLVPPTAFSGTDCAPGRPQTFGERAVGLTFNPSGDGHVHAIKTAYASLIDNLNNMRIDSSDPEVKRLCSVAITEAQGAQMWAVKAVTWRT